MPNSRRSVAFPLGPVIGDLECGNCGASYTIRAKDDARRVSDIDARRALMEASHKRCPNCNERKLRPVQ
jgi:transcription elongation factor Elf1